MRRQLARYLAGNGTGGTQRLVLDDGNWERPHVEKARRNALEHGHQVGAALAELKLNDAQLRAWGWSPRTARARSDLRDAQGLRAPAHL